MTSPPSTCSKEYPMKPSWLRKMGSIPPSASSAVSAALPLVILYEATLTCCTAAPPGVGGPTWPVGGYFTMARRQKQAAAPIARSRNEHLESCAASPDGDVQTRGWQAGAFRMITSKSHAHETREASRGLVGQFGERFEIVLGVGRLFDGPQEVVKSRPWPDENEHGVQDQPR